VSIWDAEAGGSGRVPRAAPRVAARGRSKAGSYLRLVDSCITQLKAQGPLRGPHCRLLVASDRGLEVNDFYSGGSGCVPRATPRMADIHRLQFSCCAFETNLKRAF